MASRPQPLNCPTNSTKTRGCHSATLGRKMNPDPRLIDLVGQPVAHVWFGDYSALYLELGVLTASDRTRRDGSACNPNGEMCIYAGFDWRIERPRSIFGSRNCSRKRQRSMCASLLGTTVTSASTFGRIPELQIGFSNNIWLSTFGLSRGNPEWSVSFHSPTTIHLCTNNGRLSIDRRDA